MGTARGSVAEEVVSLMEETGTTEEASVLEGAMVQTPTPPHQDGKKIRGSGKNFREGGRLA